MISSVGVNEDLGFKNDSEGVNEDLGFKNSSMGNMKIKASGMMQLANEE